MRATVVARSRRTSSACSRPCLRTIWLSRKRAPGMRDSAASVADAASGPSARAGRRQGLRPVPNTSAKSMDVLRARCGRGRPPPPWPRRSETRRRRAHVVLRARRRARRATPARWRGRRAVASSRSSRAPARATASARKIGALLLGGGGERRAQEHDAEIGVGADRRQRRLDRAEDARADRAPGCGQRRRGGLGAAR